MQIFVQMIYFDSIVTDPSHSASFHKKRLFELELNPEHEAYHDYLLTIATDITLEFL